MFLFLVSYDHGIFSKFIFLQILTKRCDLYELSNPLLALNLGTLNLRLRGGYNLKVRGHLKSNQLFVFFVFIFVFCFIKIFLAKLFKIVLIAFIKCEIN